jgi:D-alanyl-D-alanine carboxypeptidase (penicillin-binding protein 5/6)
VTTLVVLVVAAGLVSAQRIDRPLGQPTLTAGRLASLPVPGTPPVPPWPAGGQAAVAIPALGYAAQSGPEQPVPIASLTKMTTALVVLRDHPIPPGSSGPTVTITPDEAAQFDVDLANNETNIPLQAGETLTELQLLEALLVPSANDVAYTLAVWDAGSESAFVAKMNALAVALGAVHSHYTDTSGFDPGSVSTAADTLRIAGAAMAIPTFASVVDMPTVTLPGAGAVKNVVTAIGTDGIVGVKSGYTAQAAGCMVLAGFRTVDGRSVLVLASALGQREPAPAPAPPSTVPSATAPTTTAPAAPTTTTAPYSAIEAQYPLRYTEPIVEHLLDAAEGAVVAVPVVTAGHAVGTAAVDRGGVRLTVPVVASTGAWVLGVPGQRVTATLAPAAPAPTAAPVARGGAASGAVRFTLGAQTETVPVRMGHRLPDPGWWWKVLHN